MPKYKVLKEFKDIHTKDTYKQGSEIELTKKRANEVVENLGGFFLEPVKVKKDVEEAK
ncbi:hypothetical protein [Vagococcus fluvialis]|uniref:hypothetical protein n=1 Tax=Vagococcus fluvialis TaxID=2738 RepID=UPI003797000A